MTRRCFSRKAFLSIFITLILLFSMIYSKAASIRISIASDPTTYDPRLARALSDIDLNRLLFSGLTKLSHTGEIELDLAESIDSSKDGTHHTITLRQTSWSDNTPLTAHDFVYTWRSMLEKDRACPNAFFLFCLKNASLAYNESISLEKVGVRALSNRVLEIDLEQPCPFFLQLLATPAFCAVQKTYAQKEGAFSDDKPFPVSGPYIIKSRQLQLSVVLTKNKRYWAQDKHEYPNLQFCIVDDATALTMFNGKQFEWIGSPLGIIPTDCIPGLQQQNKLSAAPAAGTHFLRANVKNGLLSDVRIRRAIALSIDRNALVEHVLQGGQEPANSLTPPCLLPRKDSLCSEDRELAKQLVASYCKEKGCSPKSLTITLSHAAPNDRNSRTALAIQNDIASTLGINLRVNAVDTKQYFSMIASIDYELALGSWYADFFDPHAFLSVFESAQNGTNNTNWESPLFQVFLQRSLQVMDAEKRKEYFYELENILATEVPIIPLFYGTFNYVKESTADGIKLSPLGHINVVE